MLIKYITGRSISITVVINETASLLNIHKPDKNIHDERYSCYIIKEGFLKYF